MTNVGELISDYGRIVAKTRETRGLTREEFAKRILESYFTMGQNMVRDLKMHLDELILGDEGDQEIHTLKAKGRIYCRT